VSEFSFLAKALRPLGDKFHGVADTDTLYRQRYLDTIMHRDAHQRFQFRFAFLRAIREFYWAHDFMEVETPVLGNSASGAAAAPFITHHNEMDEDMFLRISPETALKKMTV
jgi:lysyl-tRNA synthetase class 2